MLTFKSAGRDPFSATPSFNENYDDNGFSYGGKPPRNIGKYVIIATIVTLLIGGGVFIISEIEKGGSFLSSNKDEVIAELDRLEKDKNYIQLIKILYENVDPEFSKKVLPWLEERASSGFSPYLYATARHMLLTNEPYQALLYYSAAGLTARVDAARCTDRTTASWVAFLENGFSGVREYMASHPDSRIAAGQWALLKEESLAKRPLPEWLCLNGERPSEYVPYVAEELWQQERAHIRQAFLEFVQQGPDGGEIATTEPASGKK